MGADSFSFASLLGSIVGGILGIWVAYALTP
jgi:ABC-type lipoprotein release transport system permease subunit